MTTRSLTEIGIKLIGVYFGAGFVINMFGLVASLAMPQAEGFPTGRVIALLNGFALVGGLVVAAACVFGGERIASRIFPEDHLELADISRQDMLLVGLALIGVSTIASATPAILQFFGKAIWYAQGSRQSQFLPSMEQSWQDLATHALELIAGGVLVLMASRLASALDRRYSRA